MKPFKFRGKTVEISEHDGSLVINGEMPYFVCERSIDPDHPGSAVVRFGNQAARFVHEHRVHFGVAH